MQHLRLALVDEPLELLTPLAGKPVLWYSLKAFSDSKEVDELLVVTREEQMDEIERLVTDEDFKKVRKVISGGAELAAGQSCTAAVRSPRESSARA